MTNSEKIKLIEDTLDVENGTLNEETLLSDISRYDSMAKLSLIVLFDDEFDKKLTGEKVREFRKIKDILDFMK